MSRRAQRDYQELDYQLSDVHGCLAELTETDFRQTVEYDGILYDVYHPRHRGPTGHLDELYVKLSTKPNATVPQATVVSFHLLRKG